MDERVQLVRKIKAQGYQVRGHHDFDETVESNPTTVVAEHLQTGEIYTVTIPTKVVSVKLRTFDQAVSVGWKLNRAVVSVANAGPVKLRAATPRR